MAQVIEHVARALERGAGGTIVTPNTDICRQASRDPVCADLVARASLVVPDGMPLLWAGRLAGRPLAARVTGADLIVALCSAAARRGWPVHLLGGEPGSGGPPAANGPPATNGPPAANGPPTTNGSPATGGSPATNGSPATTGSPGTAELAGRRLAARYPGLRVTGAHSPPRRFDSCSASLDALRRDLTAARPAIVFVGLGFPKQELLIERLRPDLPAAWFVGCGAAIAYAAGTLRRAPGPVQRAGLEWAWRLAAEPRRLARRYLADLPFALRLLATSAWQRSGPDAG